MNPPSPAATPGFYHPGVLLVLTLLALGLFLWALRPPLQMLLQAAPENRFDRPIYRIINTLRIALGQSKMFKDAPAGWMHAMIFWGFLVLLFRTGHFFWMGFFPDWVLPVWGPLNFSYSLIKDGFVLLVTLACLFALYRRLVTKPKRLNLSAEGIFILLLILTIMVSDVLFEAGILAAGRAESGFSGAFLGEWVSGMIRHWEGSRLGILTGINYWVHVVTILVFLNLLPRSKHFHVITSIPNVFFSNGPGGKNPLRRLDFEDESREEFGVTRIEAFSWKTMLDFHTCTECGRCDVFCPALNSGKPLSPKQLTIDLRNHLNEQTPALLAKEESPAETDPALLGQVIQDETLWSCTTCGACEEECPVMIEYVNRIVDMRRGLVMMEDRYPKELTEAFRSLETHSNPWGFPKNTREAWMKEAGLKFWDKNQPSEYLYFVGCNGAFDNRGRKVAESVVQALKDAEVDFAVLGNREGCTGDPARRLGNEYLFDMLASENAATFKEEKITKVITHCPHCFNSLKNEYPEFGATLEVIHHSELLAHLVRAGKLKTPDSNEGKVVMHDSCYMGRHNGVYDPPRNLVKAQGTKALEVETSRERGTCCGAGGARFLIEENTGTRMNHNRVDELMQAEPDTIAVSCPFCVLMLEDALKAKNLSDRVQVKDVSELIQK